MAAAGTQVGAGVRVVLRYVTACGGKTKVLGKPDQLIKRAHKLVVKSPQSGYIKSIATDRLGFLAGKLGAGRSAMTDRIDPLAGIEMMVRIGSQVSKGEPLAVGYAQTESKLAGFDRDFIRLSYILRSTAATGATDSEASATWIRERIGRLSA